MFIDANVLMQSGVADQLAAVSPAVAEQLQDAIDTGGLVRIPVAEFAARIAPTEFANGLLDHLKTEPDGMSRAEAGQYPGSRAPAAGAGRHHRADRAALAERRSGERAQHDPRRVKRDQPAPPGWERGLRHPGGRVLRQHGAALRDDA